MTPTWEHGEELSRVECGVNYANLRGRFVSISVARDDGGFEWLSLTPDEADTLAKRLREVAQHAREDKVPTEEPG